MDLNLLPILNTLLTTQSLTATSKKHGIGVPAVSRSLSRLREEYGDPLLIRSGNRMTLSAFAAAIREDIALCVTHCKTVGRTGSYTEAINAPRAFHIACTDVLAALIASSLAEQCQIRPNLVIRFVAEELVSWDALRAGEVDLVISGAIDLPVEAVVKQLFRDRVVGIVRCGHPVVKQEDGFSDIRYIVADSQLPFEPQNNRAWKQAGIVRRVALQVPSFFAAAATAESSDLMATMPALLAAELRSRYRIEIVPLPLRLPSIPVRVAWHPRSMNDQAHRWLRDEIVAIGRGLLKST